jgi:hypothetical protein
MPADILVPFIDGSIRTNLKCLSNTMDLLKRYELANHSWPNYKTVCSAYFAIGHSNETIILKFYVENDFFKTIERHFNEDVNNDNCVEFFISFANDRAYYNIEFNCLGIGKLAYGTGRENRTLIDVETIKLIKVWIRSENVGEVFDWEILLEVPISVFKYHQLSVLKETNCCGNFYKCGDELPYPHFLSFNKIDTAEPDFHQPEFFGNIFFT